MPFMQSIKRAQIDESVFKSNQNAGLKHIAAMATRPLVDTPKVPELVGL